MNPIEEVLLEDFCIIKGKAHKSRVETATWETALSKRDISSGALKNEDASYEVEALHLKVVGKVAGSPLVATQEEIVESEIKDVLNRINEPL